MFYYCHSLLTDEYFVDTPKLDNGVSLFTLDDRACFQFFIVP